MNQVSSFHPSDWIGWVSNLSTTAISNSHHSSATHLGYLCQKQATPHPPTPLRAARGSGACVYRARVLDVRLGCTVRLQAVNTHKKVNIKYNINGTHSQSMKGNSESVQDELALMRRETNNCIVARNNPAEANVGITEAKAVGIRSERLA
jgi:hypothetical protein